MILHNQHADDQYTILLIAVFGTMTTPLGEEFDGEHPFLLHVHKKMNSASSYCVSPLNFS
jgi:hypothetical protein